MSVCRKLPDGTIQKIAGHTILLDANASEIREGIINIPSLGAGASTTITVTFTDPMPDTDYMVVFDARTGGSSVSANFADINRTVTGFVCNVQNVDNSTTHSAGTVRYHAFKPIKLEGYTALQNKINNPDETPTIDSMNLVTSDGVARAIENASAVWKGTRAEWNALPATDKKKYDLAVLIDTQLIKSVDRTDGTDSDVADLTSVWTGTQAEWDAMTDAQKDKWDKAMIQDGYYGITPAVLPVGCVQAYMGSVEPPGWLICNGQTFDQSKYPDLYNVLGINKVPDLRGEFLRGAGTGTNGFTGPAVGAHQNPTEHLRMAPNESNEISIYSAPPYMWSTPYADKSILSTSTTYGGVSTPLVVEGQHPARFASRPTNVGVNWIIFAGPAQ